MEITTGYGRIFFIPSGDDSHPESTQPDSHPEPTQADSQGAAIELSLADCAFAMEIDSPRDSVAQLPATDDPAHRSQSPDGSLRVDPSRNTYQQAVDGVGFMGNISTNGTVS